MRKTWTQIKNETMTKDEQRAARVLALRDLAQMELAELREALRVTQKDLAKKLKVTQVSVSRLERRPNVLVETLSNYIRGLGGHLELHAVLPNRTIKLTHLLASAERKAARTAARSSLAERFLARNRAVARKKNRAGTRAKRAEGRR
jgi:transcriptional regulator with XRE-family HTH domain